MPIVLDSKASLHSCPFRDFSPCLGSQCMAWTWNGPAYDHCETDNLIDTEDGQRPVGVAATPDGDGWEPDGPPYKKGYHRSSKDGLPPATGQRWIRKRELTLGYCARLGRDTIPW